MLNKLRMDALSDGIFAIIMTLLVLEIKVPEISDIHSEAELIAATKDLIPLFLSYILSFSLLFTLWRGHTFFVSRWAKNISPFLSNLNALFLLSVGLLPFSSHFLGLYNAVPFGIFVYCINIICASLTLLWIWLYVIRSKEIENPDDISSRMKRNSLIRIIIPMVAALIALPLAYINNFASLFVLTIPIVFNIVPGGINLIESILTGKPINT